MSEDGGMREVMEGCEEQLRSVKRCGCELKRLHSACRQQNQVDPILQLGSCCGPPTPQFQLFHPKKHSDSWVVCGGHVCPSVDMVDQSEIGDLRSQ